MSAEEPFNSRGAGSQDPVDAVTPLRSTGELPRHALNNILARIIALADHSEQEVARRGEAVIEQAELAARLLRGEA